MTSDSKFMVPQKAELAQVADVHDFLRSTTDFRYLVAAIDGDDAQLREQARLGIGRLLRSPKRNDIPGSQDFLVDVAKNPYTPARVLNRLAEVKHYRMLNALVFNKNLPSKAATTIVNSPASKKVIRKRLTWNHHLSDEVWADIVEHYPLSSWAAICRSSNSPSWALDVIYQKILTAEDDDVKKKKRYFSEEELSSSLKGLAGNRNTPVHILEIFAAKAFSQIEEQDMFSVPSPFVRSLGHSDDPNFLVFKNRSLPQKIIEKALSIAETEKTIRDSYKTLTGTLLVNLLQNPSVDDNVLVQYEAMDNPFLTTYLVKNIRISARLLRKVVENMNNSETIRSYSLQKLVRKDPEFRVLPIEWVESMFGVTVDVREPAFR